MVRTIGSRETSPDLIEVIMRMHRGGCNSTVIGNATGVKPVTIRSIIARRGQRGKKPGAPRKLNPRAERSLLRMVRSNPQATSVELKRQLPMIQCTPRTIRNTLKRNNYRCRVARLKPLLTKKHRQARMEFALQHHGKSVSWWKRVLFSDEPKASSCSQQRKLVYRLPGTALKPKNINTSVRHGGATTLFWGCFGYNGTGPIVHINGRMTAEVYISILRHHLDAARQKLGLGRVWIFQQDNDPKHTARATSARLRRRRVRTLKWPANSPDLNPIEHLWFQVKRRVKCKRIYLNPEVLFKEIESEWNRVTANDCQELVSPMPRRLCAVLAARGGAIKY